jgi:hypothetical protein
MKIKCPCGNVIIDQTDYISYKAHFIADQDYFDACESIDARVEKLADSIRAGAKKTAKPLIDRAIHDIRGILIKNTRGMYQCAECGRLFVDDIESQSLIFVPENENAPHNMLRSKQGEKWKRPLRGDWRSERNSGDIWWGFGVEDEGFETFSNWDDLANRYYEVFARLRDEQVLRDAFLSKNGERLHQWPDSGS